MTLEPMDTEPELDERTRNILWKNAGIKNVRQLAELTGLPPEKVYAARQQIFEEVDPLTIQQQQMKLMVDLHEMVELAKKQAEDSTDPRNHAGLINAAVNAVEKTLKQLRMLEKDESAQVTELNNLRVRELIRLVGAVVEAGVSEISEVHGLDSEELLEVFRRHLVSEATAFDARAEQRGGVV